MTQWVSQWWVWTNAEQREELFMSEHLQTEKMCACSVHTYLLGLGTSDQILRCAIEAKFPGDLVTL